MTNDNAAADLMQENVWYDKWRCDEAECAYQEKLVASSAPAAQGKSAIVTEIARARQQIQNTLTGQDAPVAASGGTDVLARLTAVEQDNQALRKVADDLRSVVAKLEQRIAALEIGTQSTPAAAPEPPAPSKSAAADDDDDDDDIDLFGSDDEEDEEADRKKAELIEKYKAKKAQKPTLIAKSMITLDVKPWDDETDMAEMEKCVRTIKADGLIWGASKLVPVGYGIKKLQISTVVEDDKIGTDFLEEKITEFEDFVQSVDIAGFNKL